MVLGPSQRPRVSGVVAGETPQAAGMVLRGAQRCAASWALRTRRADLGPAALGLRRGAPGRM